MTMTISELAERIEQRLVELQQEIGRLRAADEALAATGTASAVVERRADPPSPQHHNPQAQSARATPRREDGRRSTRHSAKPTAVLALARELDAGLRNRP